MKLLMDLKRTERQLEETAREQGVDLEALLEQAGRHFQHDVIEPASMSFEEFLQILLS